MADGAADIDARCPISGEPMAPWLHVPVDWRRESTSQPIDIHWCEASLFGQVLPRPTPEQVTEFYNIAYYTHTTDEEHLAAIEHPLSFGEKVMRYLAWRVDRSIDITPEWWCDTAGAGPLECCEIGCGNGSTLATLREQGHTVVGVEPDPQARAVVAEAGVEVYDGVAECLPDEVTSRRFDLIILSHVLEHFIDPVGGLNNVVALLKPGGRLFVEVPNALALGLKVSGVAWPILEAPRHLSFFTARSLTTICGQAGLVCEQVNHRCYCRQFFRERFDEELAISQALAQHDPSFAITPARLRMRYWKLLLLSAFAAPERKYDVVNVIARKPAE